MPMVTPITAPIDAPPAYAITIIIDKAAIFLILTPNKAILPAPATIKHNTMAILINSSILKK